MFSYNFTTDDLDLFVTRVYIEPGYYNNIMVGGKDVTIKFDYTILKGSVASPSSIKYKAMLSLDRDWNNGFNVELVADGTVDNSGTGSCKICLIDN